METLLDPSDENAIADYCKNVKGGKYSWGLEYTVPGCRDFETGDYCKCCYPAKLGMCTANGLHNRYRV